MTDVGTTEPVMLDLRAFIPYRCSVVTNRVSSLLETMYGERFGLTVNGWRIMAVLGKDEPLSAKQVAEGTAMDQVRVTRALSDLAGSGMISRRTDRQDRRRIVLRLSRRGRDVYEEIVPLAVSIEHALMADMTEDEKRALRTISEKLMLRAELILGEGSDWRDFDGGEARLVANGASL